MQLHFRNRMFDYNKILKIIAIIMVYHIVSVFPYISGYHVQYITRIDIEHLICSFHEMILFLTLFGMGVSLVESNIFIKFLVSIYYIKPLNDDCVTIFIKNNKCECEENLDISNPFLYSFKTKGLLE